MVMDLQQPEVRHAHTCTRNLSTGVGILAGRRGLLSTTAGQIVIITADDGPMVIRSLLPGNPAAMALGAVQFGRALLAAGISWSVWSARDLVSGRVERELRAIAEGIPPCGLDGRAAR